MRLPRRNSSYAPAWAYYAAGFFWVALVPAWIWRQPRFGSPAVLLAAGAVVLPPAAAALVDLRGDHPSFLLATLATVLDLRHGRVFCRPALRQTQARPFHQSREDLEGVAGALAAVGLYALAWASLGGNPMRVAPAWILPVLLGLAVAGMNWRSVRNL